MPVHPQVQAFIDALGMATLPGLETLTPAAARERFLVMAELRRRTGVEAIHEVRDLTVSNSSSGGDWELDEVVAMGNPLHVA
jgi:hypothetical protein